jgi:plastocyanin
VSARQAGLRALLPAPIIDGEGAVRVRKGHLPFVVAAAAIGGLLLAGGAAESQAPTSIVAQDFAFKTAAGGTAAVTIAPGGSVDFSYPSGGSQHDVVFTGSVQPACTQSAGSSTGAVPPLPHLPASAGWAGRCTFVTPGVYPFVCGQHSSMTGSVTVAAAGTPPSPPAPSPPVAVPPPPRPPPAVPPPPPPPGASSPAASGLRVASTQRGLAVRGSVDVRSAGSRLLARALARRRALIGGSSSVQVLVGRRLRSSAGPGRVAFATPLTHVASRVLRRNGRLTISLRVRVTPPDGGGAAYTATRRVVLRAP